MCHYRHFSLLDIPAAQRENSLRLKIQQWSPYNHTANYTVWQGGHAQVWIWDLQAQQEKMQSSGIKKATVIPEPLLYTRPLPLAEETRLIHCIEGFEGQIWSEGILKGSRWWQNEPTPQEWGMFQRAHAQSATADKPVPAEYALLERPWGRTRGFKIQQDAVWIGVALLLSVITWQTVSVWKWHRATAHVNAQIETLQTQIGSILDLRNRAVADQMVIEKIMTLNPYPQQIKLLADVADLLAQMGKELKLPTNDIRLTSWFYQLGELKITVEASEIDPTVYVKAFQNHPLFTEVKAETVRQQITLTMKVKTEWL